MHVRYDRGDVRFLVGKALLGMTGYGRVPDDHASLRIEDDLDRLVVNRRDPFEARVGADEEPEIAAGARSDADW